MSGKLQLERRPCERQSCALFGQMHARCKAHAKGPRPCMMYPMHGQLVCYRHGGKAPNSIAFAKRRLIFDAVKSRVSRIVAYDGDDVTSPPEGGWSGRTRRGGRSHPSRNRRPRHPGTRSSPRSRRPQRVQDRPGDPSRSPQARWTPAPAPCAPAPALLVVSDGRLF
jgi:hypothetical protein